MGTLGILTLLGSPINIPKTVPESAVSDAPQNGAANESIVAPPDLQPGLPFIKLPLLPFFSTFPHTFPFIYS